MVGGDGGYVYETCQVPGWLGWVVSQMVMPVDHVEIFRGLRRSVVVAESGTQGSAPCPSHDKPP